MTPGIGARSMVPPAGWLDDKPDLQRGLTPGFLVLITALAAVLRFFRLDGQSLWVDEIFTWIGTRPTLA